MSAQRPPVVQRLRDRLYSQDRSLFNGLLERELSGTHNILLFGAGRGLHESDWRSKERRVVGVDIDPVVFENKVLDEAHVYDGVHLPFGTASFDLCVARWVIEHLPNPILSFKEIARVLKREGRFVFVTSNRWFYAYLLASLIPNRLHPALVRWGIGRAEADTFPTFYRGNSRRRLRTLLGEAGFEEEFLALELSGADYLEFAVGAYLLGVLYERIVNRFPLLSDLRQAIVGCFVRRG